MYFQSLIEQDMKKVLLVLLLFLFVAGGLFLLNKNKNNKPSVVRIGITTNVDTLLPYNITRSEVMNIVDCIYDSLCEIDDKTNEVRFPIVEKSEIKENKIVLTLKKGIFFHNGAELTAVDVKYSLQKALEANRFNFAASIFCTIQDIETPERYSLILHLSEFFPPLLHNLQFVTIVNPYTLDEVNGTGAFMLSEISPEKIILDRNPKYFKGLPKSKGIMYRVYDNQHQLWRALIEGEIDFSPYMIYGDFENLKENTLFKSYTSLAPYYYFIALNNEDSLFSSKTIRLALNYAIDKQKIIDEYLGGYGVLCKGTIFPESWAYNDEIEALRYNPQKAVGLLKQEGWNLDPEKRDY